VTAGTKLAILGVGGLGMQGILIGRLLGAHVTATSRNDEKLDMARSLGADFVINTARDNFVDASKRRVGSFDVVIDNIGTPESVVQSLTVLRNGGKLVEVGFAEPAFQAPFYDIVVREKQVLGSQASSRSDFREVVDLVNQGKIDPSIGESIPIGQVNQALENLKNGKYLTRNVLVLPF